MLNTDQRALYAAFKAKDARFDGRFFVGISSTGIYCRPVCRARQPKAENCTFYATAAQAEQAGYRPCLLCRPELAPGTSRIDATASLAERATQLLEENCGSEHRVEELAERLGCTDRHLRRVFAEKYHVSPSQYLQTCRLLLAKNLLTDTDLPIIDVAMASGFGSLRRFNDLFKKQYRLTPSALRKQMPDNKKDSGDITLLLAYRPPYLWKNILDFFASRAIPGVEIVKNDEYLRTVRLVSKEQKTIHGWIKVAHRPQNNALAVTLDSALLPVLPQVLNRVRYLFDLHCDPDVIYSTLNAMNTIRPELCVLGMRLPGCFDPFEMMVRAVLGQQITVKAAGTLAARFTSTYGTAIETKIEGLSHIFPAPDDIVALKGDIANHLGPLGITSARAKTILELATMLAHGSDADAFDHYAQPEMQMNKLLAVSGVGPWTAQYIAMRAMGWPDAFPHTDYGVKKALAPRTPKEILTLAQDWRPWRSYATINLWNSLSSISV